MAQESKCPVNHTGFIKTTSSSTSSNTATGCPMPRETPSLQNNLNRPENQMPHLSQMPSPSQQTLLATTREISTIPKSSDKSLWEYPSPQQFYNALVKKGWETPEGEVQTMVDIHNWMNEGSWYGLLEIWFYERQEILRWEKRNHKECLFPSLKKFQGRPNDLSPKARFLNTFGLSPKPFDRHDWTIDRCGKEVRYVIDYYSGEEGLENPEFFIDVRPALDSPSAFSDRSKAFVSELWEKYVSTTKSE